MPLAGYPEQMNMFRKTLLTIIKYMFVIKGHAQQIVRNRVCVEMG
jgi:hypothetical protein